MPDAYDPYTVAYGPLTHRVISASYHRNGSEGAGFFVALVDTTESGETHRFLVTIFPEYDEEGNRLPRVEMASALRVDQIAAGNIGMYSLLDPRTGEIQEGTGNAAYRGAGYYGQPLLPVILAWIEDSRSITTR